MLVHPRNAGISGEYMEEYTIKNAGLMQELEVCLEGEIAREGETTVRKSDLSVIWEGGHGEDAPFREPLIDWCNRYGWTHSYDDYQRVVKLRPSLAVENQ